ncbi:hypothetical protein KX816_08675 [Sphingosinicellaceae bacterium]|nr:hypothetical protein KX816_08675 [Sphingosinicellaceae bacterium]
MMLTTPATFQFGLTDKAPPLTNFRSRLASSPRRSTGALPLFVLPTKTIVVGVDLLNPGNSMREPARIKSGSQVPALASFGEVIARKAAYGGLVTPAKNDP